MFLEKIEIQGFKSFAKKTTIDFSQASARGGSITAIIGPNGSGKSNIADAIRWVLGEQSIKNLRGKKSEDIIFSGSDKHARLGLAEVTLFLNNEEKKTAVEYPQIEITRRLYRSGDSEYLINRRKVRLTDVSLLLAKARFGQKTYSVIGQGMIDSILSATPLERKNFFDEAAGIKEFQIKRDLSTSKLNLTITNLEQAEALVREIEPRLKILTRQVNRLKQREQLEKDLRAAQLTYYSILWKHLDAESARLFEHHQQILAEKNKKSEELSKIQIELKALEKEEVGPDNQFVSLQKMYEKLLNERTALKEKEIRVQNAIELQRRIQEKSPHIKSLGEIIRDLESYVRSFEKIELDLKDTTPPKDADQILSAIITIKKKILSHIRQLKDPEGTRKKLNDDPKLLHDLSEITHQLKEHEKLLSQAQQNIANYRQESQRSKGRVFELQRAFQARQVELNKISSRLQEVDIEKARVDTRKEDLEKEIHDEGISLKLLAEYHAPSSNTDELAREIRLLKHRLELIGGIEPETMKEYTETKERFDFLTHQMSDLQKATQDLIKIIDELDETIKKSFHQSFKCINEHFEKYFKVLFGGGKANLIMQREVQEDQELSLDAPTASRPFGLASASSARRRDAFPSGLSLRVEDMAERHEILRTQQNIAGIEIHATPPGKKLTSIHILSGGEKALTSIALICAIISSNPSPFVVLDEVDAALDEANSERFSNILKELSHKTQFIVITHNRNTMEKAKELYGITMGKDGISRLLSIKLEDAPVIES